MSSTHLSRVLSPVELSSDAVSTPSVWTVRGWSETTGLPPSSAAALPPRSLLTFSLDDDEPFVDGGAGEGLGLTAALLVEASMDAGLLGSLSLAALLGGSLLTGGAAVSVGVGASPPTLADGVVGEAVKSRDCGPSGPAVRGVDSRDVQPSLDVVRPVHVPAGPSTERAETSLTAFFHFRTISLASVETVESA